MDSKFSEFSYGYALTEALARQLGPLKGAPIFPSLYNEGQVGGGHDLELPTRGTPLFLQFKVSHYLWRTNALEWDYFGGPYYRMYLRPLRHSDQHILLLDLENAGKRVYYAVPRFHRVDELNDAYQTGNVVGRSAFIRPMSIGMLDDEQHYVVFERDSRVGYL